jgi:hypothetical protein
VTSFFGFSLTSVLQIIVYRFKSKKRQDGGSIKSLLNPHLVFSSQRTLTRLAEEFDHPRARKAAWCALYRAVCPTADDKFLSDMTVRTRRQAFSRPNPRISGFNSPLTEAQVSPTVAWLPIPSGEEWMKEWWEKNQSIVGLLYAKHRLYKHITAPAGCTQAQRTAFDDAAHKFLVVLVEHQVAEMLCNHLPRDFSAAQQVRRSRRTSVPARAVQLVGDVLAQDCQ